jgi:hypothetical protein
MASRSRRSAATMAISLAVFTLAPLASAQQSPRYLAQMQAELQAMNLSPQCAATSAQSGACSLRASAAATPQAPARRRFYLALTYDDRSDAIYVFFERYATLRSDAANAAAVSRRLLEMNWEMLIGKFEWNSTSGEIRLSTVLHTDSNFDRRAFRSIVHSMLRLADRYANELATLTGNAVGEAVSASDQPAAAGATSAGAAQDAGTARADAR